MYSYVFECFVVSQLIRCTSSFRQNAKYANTGTPSGDIARGLGAIRALRSAWQALKTFLSAGVE